MDLNIVLAVASIVLFLALIGYFGYLVYHQQQVEPEEKPATGVELLRQHYEPGDTVEQPTPYWVAPIPAAPDPLEISSNLDRKIVAGAAMLFALFALTGGYFFNLYFVRADASSDRWRDAVAMQQQLEKSIHRGKNLYANFCYNCHGKLGLGNGENDKDGEPLPGKPLNRTDFKYEAIKDDPQRLKTQQDFLALTIARGKKNNPPNYSMPAWGISEGGPFNPEQVNQLVDFILHGAEEDWADIVTIRVHLAGVENADVDPGERPKALTGGEALGTYCTTCHSVTAGQASVVPAAPNLSDYGVKGPLNDELKRLKDSGDPDWLFTWVSNAPKVKPGVIMPAWLVSEGGTLDEATVRSIVEYLQTLGK